MKNLLKEISKNMISRKEKTVTLDLSQEANKLYFELGKLIQTKILFLIEEEKNWD